MHETSSTKTQAQTGSSEVAKVSKQLWQSPEMQSLVIQIATEQVSGSAPQLPG